MLFPTKVAEAAPALADTTAHAPSQSAEASRPVWLGGLLAVSIVAAWLALIHNRFFTPHEGWFSYYGFLIRNGQIPYRDFYFFTQPMSLLIARTIEQFGDKLIYFRYYGLGERIVLTTALYYLLSRHFSAAASVCATVASSFFFLAYITDALFTYLYTCLLFFVLALVCLQEAWRDPRRRSLWLLLAGFSASLSFFTKQSNGLLAIAAIGFSILIISPSFRAALSDLTRFAVGVAVGAVPFIGWLVLNGAWHPYLKEVFLGAAASKGGLQTVLFGFLTRQITPLPMTCFLSLAVIAGLLVKKKQLCFVGPDRRLSQLPYGLLFSLVGGAAALAIITVHRIGEVPVFLLKYSSTVIVEVMMYALLPLLLFVLWRRFGRLGAASVQGYELPITLLVASFFWTWSCGMSWRVEEQSAIPSLALLLAFIYDRIQLGRGSAMNAVVLAATIFFIFAAAFQKWNVAFNWEGWRESISVEGAHSHWEQIADYKLDRKEAAMYDAIFDDIARYTHEGDQIVTFPTIPLFNFVSRRRQPTFAPVEYWDVCPDDVARLDAQRVKAARPRMIVSLELSDSTWKEHDEGWRGGRKSGQRDFQDAIDSLTSSGDYRLLRSYLTPFYKTRLRVWLREQ